MPANVSVAARASVTAGLANDVDDVKYALVMKQATATGTACRIADGEDVMQVSLLADAHGQQAFCVRRGASVVLLAGVQQASVRCPPLRLVSP
jgi:hypothetical protein